MKFRKKAVEIEAEQYFLDREIVGVVKLDKPIVYTDFTFVAQIKTLEDTEESSHYVRESDWIITGVFGEKYACQDDIFKATYDQVEEFHGPHYNS